MKKIAMLSLFAMSAFAASWTGYISDSGCGAKHADGSAGAIKCVTGCIKGKGAAPVLVVGDKVLKVDAGSKDKVMDHLGQKVTVNGKLAGDTVTIDSVSAAN
ncbi:MAG: hypothetical protein IT167_12670 [Bryobacterales bacterium]|nr:hypothetical protein [Bryobacterales bacterium]